MKNFKQTILSILIIIAVFTSCKKNTDVIQANTNLTVASDESANKFISCSTCLVTHTEDDFLGDAIDFFYNKKGNPDSLIYDGTTLILKYDNRDRLIKINFGTYAYFDFKYRDIISPLPIALYYYYPFFGGLQAIDSFHYNLLGQIEKTVTFGTATQTSSVENYKYDYRGNIIKVDMAPAHGATGTSYTEFTAASYDHNPNLMAGNKWLKFIFFFSDWYASPYFWTLSSRNNPADYKWIYDAQGDSYSFTSSFTYDSKSFANTVNLNVYDNVAGAELGAFARTSSSTCDISRASLISSIPAKSAFRNTLKKLPFSWPSVIQK